jgi:hypothetical protein
MAAGMRFPSLSNATPRVLVGLSLSLALAACGGSDAPATAPVLPDPETPSAPVIPVATATATLAADSIAIGDTTRARVVLRSSAGLVLSGRAVTWRSSAPAVATVDSTGLVTARTEGQAQITATSEGIVGTATVTVRPVPVASVTINAPLLQKVGEPYTLEAIVRTADGTEVTRPVTWRVRDTTLATITATGVLTPKAVGDYLVEVDVDGRTWGRGFTSYDWGSTWAQDAVLWSEDTLDIGNRFQLLGLSCAANGEFYTYVSLYGALAGDSTVRVAIDNDAPTTQTWTLDVETQRNLFLPGSNAQKLAFADRLATARKLSVTVTLAGGATRTITWRVAGLAARLAAIAPTCR